jgi:hypothetical protein
VNPGGVFPTFPPTTDPRYAFLMNERNEHKGRPKTGGSHDGTLPDRAIVVLLGALADALVGGYFFVMKLIDMGRTEDCLMFGRRNCAPIDLPARR